MIILDRIWTTVYGRLRRRRRGNEILDGFWATVCGLRAILCRRKWRVIACSRAMVFWADDLRSRIAVSRRLHRVAWRCRCRCREILDCWWKRISAVLGDVACCPSGDVAPRASARRMEREKRREEKKEISSENLRFYWHANMLSARRQPMTHRTNVATDPATFGWIWAKHWLVIEFTGVVAARWARCTAGSARPRLKRKRGNFPLRDALPALSCQCS